VRSEADGWSLLLLDELGTGTDPTEGAALGQALLKALVRGERWRRGLLSADGAVAAQSL
jgi:dsDNA-specific endonuclease/ATPase MutS2